MKHLTIVRHAKSSWKFPDLADHDRPLNGRGERDAPMMGKRLVKRGNGPPDLILSSPAVRALTTAKVLADVLGYPRKRIVTDSRIYGAGVSSLIDVLQETDDDLKRVMLFGHNPAMTGLVNRLSSEPVDNLPTCGVAEFMLGLESWTQLGESVALEFNVDYPKKGLQDD